MFPKKVVFLEAVPLCVLLVGVHSQHQNFPPGFKFGAATSAFQVEGAWNTSGTGIGGILFWFLYVFFTDLWNIYIIHFSPDRLHQKWCCGDGLTTCHAGLKWLVKRGCPPHCCVGVYLAAGYPRTGKHNREGKGESIWDRFTHDVPGSVVDGTNADIASDSYHHWMRDIQIASELGLDFYRFSISWPRLLPTGFANNINEDGKSYYNRLIDELLAHGIEPVVTIHHLDLPQKLQDLGGWTNPLITEWFESYAEVVFSLYADRVKTWITINEPLINCHWGYNTGTLAPGIISPNIGEYLCTKNVLVAHAKAWRVYDKRYRRKYGGKVSICNQYVWFEPLTPEDGELAELSNELGNGLVSHPIYSKEGGWPPRIEKIITENSRNEGYTRSRLPKFTKEEVELVKGTFDYIAFNHYTSRMVSRANPDEKLGPWPGLGSSELGIKLSEGENWRPGTTPALPIYPEGFRKIIVWFKKLYGDVNIIITENGYATSGSNLNDNDRIQYHKEYMEQLLLAITEDKANVTGYSVWSLIDTFEWGEGYRIKFGLYEVDFDDPNRKRTPRKSALFYTSVIRHHSLNVPDVQDIVLHNKAYCIIFNSLYSCSLLLFLYFWVK